MATTRDDAAHASVLVAESVVALARAEIHLALSSARARGVRLLLALGITALALLLVQAAFAVLMLSPVLFSFHPLPTLVAVGLSLGLATSASLVAWRRWRSFGDSGFPQGSHDAAATDLEGTRA